MPQFFAPLGYNYPPQRQSNGTGSAMSALAGRVGALLLLTLLNLVSIKPSLAQSNHPVFTYDTGLGDNGAEIIAVRDNYAVLTNSGDGSVDILDLSNLPTIQWLKRVKSADLTGVTSVAIHPTQDYFIAVAGAAAPRKAPVTGLAVVIQLSTGAVLTKASVGIQPDSIAIAPNGTYAVVANEAEGFAEGDDGGDGSLSLINLTAFNPITPTALSVTQIALPSQVGVTGFSQGRADDLARLPIDNTPGTLEPEFVAFSPDSRYAFVTLQENNAIVRLRLADRNLTFFGLGRITHLADITEDEQYLPVTRLTTYREPDAIATVTLNNQLYLVTANEGDTRAGNGDSSPRGGRTVSVFHATTGYLVGDTDVQIDLLAHLRGLYPDDRSPRGGAEPEGIDLFSTSLQTIAAVTLERANAVAFVHIGRSGAPNVLDVVPVGDNPEGVKLVRRDTALYAITANEGAGTLSVVRVPDVYLPAGD